MSAEQHRVQSEEYSLSHLRLLEYGDIRIPADTVRYQQRYGTFELLYGGGCSVVCHVEDIVQQSLTDDADEQHPVILHSNGIRAELLENLSSEQLRDIDGSGSSMPTSGMVAVYFKEKDEANRFRQHIMRIIAVSERNPDVTVHHQQQKIREELSQEKSLTSEAIPEIAQKQETNSELDVPASHQGLIENTPINQSITDETATVSDVQPPEIADEAGEEASYSDKTVDLSNKKSLDPTGLYVPWELCKHLGLDILRPLAKIQALKNTDLYLSIQTELLRRGENAGMKMLNISREIAVGGYFREIGTLWDNYSEDVKNDFEFVFIRILSFLYWARTNIHPLTDLGMLDVEKLLLCYNRRWGETSVARKRFDALLRQIIFDLKDLLAIRNWCGILREKTVVDLAIVRAEHLTVIDLGTMVPKGPFNKWNLNYLFQKLTNIEDFTWLNCDMWALCHLESVDSLKRLVLHITKYNQNYYKKFFARFGYNDDAAEDDKKSTDGEEWSEPQPDRHVASCRFYGSHVDIFHDRDDSPPSRRRAQMIAARFCTLPKSERSDPVFFTGQQPLYPETFRPTPWHSGRTETKMKQETSSSSSLSSASSSSSYPSSEDEDSTSDVSIIEPDSFTSKVATEKVHLEYAALSLAHSIFAPPEFVRKNIPLFPPPEHLYDDVNFNVPKVIFKADTVILNIEPDLYSKDLLKLGPRKVKFSVGFPKEICANIEPNRSSFASIARMLNDHITLCKARRQQTVVDEIEIHVMVDYYRSERLVHLCNLALDAFGYAKALRIHFRTAGQSVKKHYYWGRYVAINDLLGYRLTVFELTIDCFATRAPAEVLGIFLPCLEELYITMSGLPHKDPQTIEDIMHFFQNYVMKLTGVKIVIFRTNAPYFFPFFESLAVASASISTSTQRYQLETLGIVCRARIKKSKRPLSGRIYNVIKRLHPDFRVRLKKLILDGRVLGELSAQHFAHIHEAMPNCAFEAEIAPEDSKDLRRRMADGVYRRRFNQNSSDSTPERAESDGSESPVLDDGDEIWLRSDYSDAQEEAGSEIITEIINAKHKKKGKIEVTCEGDMEQAGPSGYFLRNRIDLTNRRSNMYSEDSSKESGGDEHGKNSNAIRKRRKFIHSKHSSNGTEVEVGEKDKFLGKRTPGKQKTAEESEASSSDEEEWQPAAGKQRKGNK